MFIFTHRGNFKKTEKFLTKNQKIEYKRILDFYGNKGVAALTSVTPIDTGKTAHSWYYSTHISKNSFSVSWYNTNMADIVPIAILIQYGHATKDGGYIKGRDYINPAIQPIFDEIANAVWREVINV